VPERRLSRGVFRSLIPPTEPKSPHRRRGRAVGKLTNIASRSDSGFSWAALAIASYAFAGLQSYAES